MLLSAYVQMFGYSPLKIQCTAILLDRMNLKSWGTSAPPAPPLSTLLTKPRKQLHALTAINANFTILSAVTYIFIFIGGYEVTSCSSMEPSMHAYGYSQTSDFQEALWKVIMCPDRYPLTNVNGRCSVFATHLYFWKQSFGELPE